MNLALTNYSRGKSQREGCESVTLVQFDVREKELQCCRPRCSVDLSGVGSNTRIQPAPHLQGNFTSPECVFCLSFVLLLCLLLSTWVCKEGLGKERNKCLVQSCMLLGCVSWSDTAPSHRMPQISQQCSAVSGIKKLHLAAAARALALPHRWDRQCKRLNSPLMGCKLCLLFCALLEFIRYCSHTRTHSSALGVLSSFNFYR